MYFPSSLPSDVSVTNDIKIMTVYTGSDFLERFYGNSPILVGKLSLLFEMSRLYTLFRGAYLSQVPRQIPVEFKKTEKAGRFFDMSVPTYLLGVDDELIESSRKVFAPKYFADMMEIEDKSIVLKPSVPKFNSRSLKPSR